MELQQERIVQERKLQHDQVTELQLLVFDELSQISELALVGLGDRPFVRHAVAFLLGRGALTEFNFGLSSGYDWCDNARLWILTAIVHTVCPEAYINKVRLAEMIAYLKRHPLRGGLEGFEGKMYLITGMMMDDVLALA